MKIGRAATTPGGPTPSAPAKEWTTLESRMFGKRRRPKVQLPAPPGGHKSYQPLLPHSRGLKEIMVRIDVESEEGEEAKSWHSSDRDECEPSQYDDAGE